MKRPIAVVFLLALASAAVALAESPPLTLRQAIVEALSSSPRLRVADDGRALAGIRERQAASRFGVKATPTFQTTSDPAGFDQRTLGMSATLLSVGQLLMMVALIVVITLTAASSRGGHAPIIGLYLVNLVAFLASVASTFASLFVGRRVRYTDVEPADARRVSMEYSLPRLVTARGIGWRVRPLGAPQINPEEARIVMVRLRTILVGFVGILGLVAAGTASASAHESHPLLEFSSMTPVTGAAVGAVNDRGITGGGKPWAITSGSGELDNDGTLHITVTGLVIPVAPFDGTNPVARFGAIVSCLTRGGVVNVSTATVPASASGDATIDGSVALPKHCKDPIVFVTSPTGAWFAMSNGEEKSED